MTSTSSASTTTTSSTTRNKNKSVPYPPKYDDLETRKKAEFLINKVCYKVTDWDNNTISSHLGYCGTNGTRDVETVLTGNPRNYSDRIRKLQTALEEGGFVYRVNTSTTSASSSTNNNKKDEDIEALKEKAKNLIELCITNGKSLKEISLWLQYNGENAKRNVNTVMEGNAKDLSWRLDCLQIAMQDEEIIEQDDEDDDEKIPSSTSAPAAVAPAPVPSQQQKQQKPTKTVKPSSKSKQLPLKCDLPLGRRPTLRTFTKDDLNDAFDEFDEVDDALGNNNHGNTTNGNDDDDDYDVPCCPICLVDFKIGDKIAETVLCNHIFHAKCVEKWFSQENSPCCPHCGQNQVDGCFAVGDDAADGSENNNNQQPSSSSSSGAAVASNNDNEDEDETEDFVKAPTSASVHVFNLTSRQMDKIWKESVALNKNNNNSTKSAGGAFQNEPEQIGHGASARIFKGLMSSLPKSKNNNNNKKNKKSNNDDEFVAIKIFNKNAPMEEYKKELDILTSLPPHENILHPLAFCALPEWKCIVFPLYQSIEIDRKNSIISTPLEEQQRLALIFDIALGVEYLHSSSETSKKTTKKEGRIAHRDIKVENILLGERLPQKRGILADLGSARRDSTKSNKKNNKKPSAASLATMTRVIGTSVYLDDELIEYAQKNSTVASDGAYMVPSSLYFPADIYSLGITFAILITGRIPTNNAQRQEMLSTFLPAQATQQNGELVWLKQRAMPLVELIQSMTLKPSAQRPTAAQVVQRLREIATGDLSPQQKDQFDTRRNRPLREILCQRCSNGQRDCAFVPCGHKLFCEDCINGQMKDILMKKGCPLCAAVITKYEKVSPTAPTKVIFAKK